MRRVDTPSMTDDARSPLEQLETCLRHPHSELLRRRFFAILAAIERPDELAPWIRAARELHARGVIDDDGWVYFAAIFLECLTQGDAVSDHELVRIQREINAFDESQRDDDDYDEDESPELRALFAAYEARARTVEATYLRDLGYADLAHDVERDYDAFVERSSVGATKLFDGEET